MRVSAAAQARVARVGFLTRPDRIRYDNGHQRPERAQCPWVRLEKVIQCAAFGRVTRQEVVPLPKVLQHTQEGKGER